MTDERQGANYVQIEGDVDPSITSTTASSQVAPSTDEGGARDRLLSLIYDLWNKQPQVRGYTGQLLPVIAPIYEDSVQAFETAIRAPLEERLLVAETLVAVRTRKLDEAEARAARSHELRRAAEARELRARDAAAILGRSRWQARKDLAAAEERIRELEAVAFHTDGIMHIATERIETLEAEVERLREALRKSANDVLWVHRRLEHYLAPWDSDEEARILRDAHSALATPPSSTEGTKEVEG